jgi:hypothetical protein
VNFTAHARHLIIIINFKLVNAIATMNFTAHARHLEDSARWQAIALPDGVCILVHGPAGAALQ